MYNGYTRIRRKGFDIVAFETPKQTTHTIFVRITNMIPIIHIK